MKRLWNILLTCTLILCCVVLPVNAVESSVNPYIVSRVSGKLNHSISASDIIYLHRGTISLDENEIISYNCTYTPKSASIDFGYVDSNNVFFYLNCTNGNISQSIKIEKRGQYTLAIRNNESYTITITGTVTYMDPAASGDDYRTGIVKNQYGNTATLEIPMFRSNEIYTMVEYLYYD